MGSTRRSFLGGLGMAVGGLILPSRMFGGGNIPTHYWRNDGRGNTGVSDWINCGIDTAMSLEELSALTER